MRRAWPVAGILVAATAVALVVYNNEAQVVPNPTTCEGYPEKRVYLENQSWVEPQPDDGSGHPGIGKQGHIHMGTCFPLHQNMTSDTLSLDIRFQQHNVVADPVFIKIQAYTFPGTKVILQPPPIPRCETVDCDQWVHVDFPLDEVQESGWVNLQIWLSVDIPDGTADPIQWYNLNRWFFYLDNGKPLHSEATNNVRIGGDTWIENDGGLGGNYSESRIDTEDFPWDFTTGQMIPLSGVWTPNVHFDRSPAPGHGMAMIDPALHAVPVNHGTMVYDGPGARDVDLSIDTTQFSNGMHRLLLVSCNPDVVAGVDSFTNCGVMVVPFLVQNGITTTTTAPTTTTTEPMTTTDPTTTTLGSSTTTTPASQTVEYTTAVGVDDGHRAGTGAFTTNFVRVGLSTSPRSGWVRLAGGSIPQGATINTAYLTLVNGSGNGTINTNIYGVDEDTHAAPTSEAAWQTDHSLHTSMFVPWDFTGASSGSRQSPSLVPVIQELVDRPGFNGAIGLHIDDDGSGGSQDFRHHEAGPGSTVLHVEYTP